MPTRNWPKCSHAWYFNYKRRGGAEHRFSARNKSWKNDRYTLTRVAAFTLPDGSRLGDKAIGAITQDDLEAVVQALRAKGRATSTRNQYV